MAKTQLQLDRIEIHQLKGLKDVVIDFSKRPLTAILGPNGVGKSTILHALSCANNPVTVPFASVNHRLCEFFTPTTNSKWAGSSFDVIQSFMDGMNTVSNHRTHFSKKNDRWSPRYSTRIERYVSYVGIRTCVPRIEIETKQSRIQFSTVPLTDKISNNVRQYAGTIMNRNYDSYNELKTHDGGQYIGVSTSGMTYSSLSMGAGEQRIFYILGEVLKSPKYGLILIDEIDLLLHQSALFSLLKIINQIAEDNKLQVIFTTHAQSILSLDFIAFRHIYPTPEKTLCFDKTTPDALARLTGKPIRPLEIFVEDDLARTLIAKICSQESMLRYVSINQFGAAINCFTSVCGAILNKSGNLDNMLFVLDGDVYRSDKEKKERIDKILTGTAPENDCQRNKALTKISQFNLPEKESPERYYHGLICKLADNFLSDEQLDIVQTARQIQNPGDDHDYFNKVIKHINLGREVGLDRLVQLLSLTDKWSEITSNIRQWLDEKRDTVVE